MGDMADFVNQSGHDNPFVQPWWCDPSLSPPHRHYNLKRWPGGGGIPIKKMTDQHLTNAIAYIRNKGWETPFLRVLLAEQRRRNSDRADR